MFSKETYTARRKKLMSQLGTGLILLPGNLEVGMNYRDNTFRFRQDSNFLYFCGIDQPGLALLLDIDAGKTWLVGEEISLDHIIWMGPQPTLASLAEKNGLSGVISVEKMVDLFKNRPVHFTPPYREDRNFQLAKWLKIRPEMVEKKASIALCKAIIALRQHKSAEEIERDRIRARDRQRQSRARLRQGKKGADDDNG